MRLKLGNSVHNFFYLWPMTVLAPEPSPILRYSESTKTISFSILGFFRPGVKLGFEFLGVLLNQKLRPWSLSFDFDEERNPMLGSLKNSSSIKIPNFPQQKLKKWPKSNYASIKKYALQWRVSLASFFWWSMERVPKIKNPYILQLHNVFFSG